MIGKSERLSDFYDREVNERATRPIDPERLEHRSRFVELLVAESRTRLIDLGSGPGRDAAAFSTVGLNVECVDLSAANVDHCRRLGVAAYHASLLQLPFSDRTYQAAWTMSTVVHLDDHELERSLAEIVRVLLPGAPVAIGAWAADPNGPTPVQRMSTGPRPFCFRSNTDMQALVTRYGSIEQFETWRPLRDPDRTYQWIVLRTPG